VGITNTEEDKTKTEKTEENPETTPTETNDGTQEENIPPAGGGEKADYTVAQYKDIVTKVRKENAATRQKNKAKEEELRLANEKLAKYQQAEKDRELADASELEKRDIQIKDLIEQNTTLTGQLGNATGENRRLKVGSLVTRLMSAKKRVFSSDFERQGLLAQLHTKKADGSYLTDEEVTEQVNAFLDDTFQGAPAVPKKPKVDDTGEKTLAMNELKELMAKPKGTLTPKELARVAILQQKIAGPGRTSNQPKGFKPTAFSA
jgi:hypothetical protein